MKTYHFLAGLPRTGNTLLSAILNQNPDIYCSSLSPVNGFYWDITQSYSNTEYSVRNDNSKQVDYMLNNLMKNYYEKIDKPIIIDREKAWATPANITHIKKYITPTPKIIFTYRPIIEILASWIKILPEQSFIDIEMENCNWFYKNYLTKNDNRCDYLMRPFGQIDKLLMSVNEIIKSENKKTICLIKYDEIINAPEQTINKIYKFLELPSYKHNFNNIKKIEQDNDGALGQPVNLHDIRPQLKKLSKNPKEVLSEYVINKYSNIGWEA
jgi:sulfotransferase